MTLRLDTIPAREMRTHAEQAYPHECCGALIGKRDKDAVTVTRAVPMQNLDTQRAHDRFTLDPRELMQVERAADRDGLELIGFYHSHPDHPARPSQTDLAFAGPWPGLSWMIMSVQKGTMADIRSWVVPPGGDRFEEEPVEAPK